MNPVLLYTKRVEQDITKAGREPDDLNLKTDEEIAVLVQGGNIEVFAELVSRYEDKLSRYARKFLFDDEDAKDLVQDVFIKAYANIQSFEARQRFSPWIYRIAHNEFINAIKKRTRRETVSIFDFDLLLPHPVAKERADSEAERQELKRILDRSLEKIDIKYKEPLVLYYFEEMNYTEIAEILHIPVSTVGVRLQRGKVQLKKLVEPQ